MLTNIGHRFGHQSGPDGNSGQKSNSLQNGAALRVYECCRGCTKTQTIDNNWLFLDQHGHFSKKGRFFIRRFRGRLGALICVQFSKNIYIYIYIYIYISIYIYIQYPISNKGPSRISNRMLQFVQACHLRCWQHPFRLCKMSTNTSQSWSRGQAWVG